VTWTLCSVGRLSADRLAEDRFCESMPKSLFLSWLCEGLPEAIGFVASDMPSHSSNVLVWALVLFGDEGIDPEIINGPSF